MSASLLYILQTLTTSASYLQLNGVISGRQDPSSCSELTQPPCAPVRRTLQRRCRGRRLRHPMRKNDVGSNPRLVARRNQFDAASVQLKTNPLFPASHVPSICKQRRFQFLPPPFGRFARYSPSSRLWHPKQLARLEIEVTDASC